MKRWYAGAEVNFGRTAYQRFTVSAQFAPRPGEFSDTMHQAAGPLASNGAGIYRDLTSRRIRRAVQ